MPVSAKVKQPARDLLKNNELPKSKKPILLLNLQYFNHDFHQQLAELLSALKRLDLQIVIAPHFHASLKKNLAGFFLCPENLLEEATKLSTMSLFLSDDEHIIDLMYYAFFHSSVPICFDFKKYSPVLRDFNPVKESGNCFLFKSFDKWDIFAAVVRALENHRFSYDWENLLREGYNAADGLDKIRRQR